MVQRTKQKHTDEVETTEEVPTEVNEQSASVMEDACCLVNEINDLLDEVAKEQEEKAEAEATAWDPWGEQPSEPRPYDDAFWVETDKGDHLFLDEKFENAANDFEQKMQQWHEVRGMTYSVTGFGTKAASQMSNGCVC